jgi:uncharacterized coiled-coil protein SlyX
MDLQSPPALEITIAQSQKSIEGLQQVLKDAEKVLPNHQKNIDNLINNRKDTEENHKVLQEALEVHTKILEAFTPIKNHLKNHAHQLEVSGVFIAELQKLYLEHENKLLLLSNQIKASNKKNIEYNCVVLALTKQKITELDEQVKKNENCIGQLVKNMIDLSTIQKEFALQHEQKIETLQQQITFFKWISGGVASCLLIFLLWLQTHRA